MKSKLYAEQVVTTKEVFFLEKGGQLQINFSNDNSALVNIIGPWTDRETLSYNVKDAINRAETALDRDMRKTDLEIKNLEKKLEILKTAQEDRKDILDEIYRFKAKL